MCIDALRSCRSAVSLHLFFIACSILDHTAGNNCIRNTKRCGWRQVRIEGMLMAAPPLLLCFQISQLLAFYARTVAGLIGAHSRLADALAACCKLARRVFAEQLKARGDRMLRYPPAPPADLSPPPQVHPNVSLRHAHHLKEPVAPRLDAMALFP